MRQDGTWGEITATFPDDVSPQVERALDTGRMTGIWHVWVSGALLLIGVELMAVPAAERARRGGEAGPKTIRKSIPLVYDVAGYISTILGFCFALAIGIVWYKVSFFYAGLFATAAAPNRLLHDLVPAFLQPPRSAATITKILVACLLLGTVLAGFGAYRLAGGLAKL